ncbi:MAG: hypothetical protein PHS73_01095 [Candidatus Peribacteraceae bacterium]|nr:hypothetical protein [Candidatus Peribacteraceae bacterium]
MPDDQESFERLCQRALQAAGKVSPAQRDIILADLGLRNMHPSEYVAFIDGFPFQGHVRRLLRRVLAHHSDLLHVTSAFSDFGDRERARVRVKFLDPLSGDLHAGDCSRLL